MITRSGDSVVTPADSLQTGMEAVLNELKAKLTGNNISLDKSISKYSGTKQGSAQLWIKDYERLARLKGWDDSIKALSLPLFLQGTARHWIDHIEESVQDDWADLKAQFLLKHKLTQGEVFEKNDLLSRRVQGENETVEDYLMAMSKLAHELDKSDDDIRVVAMRGIHARYQEQVIYQQPTTFNELLAAGQLVEGIHKAIHGNKVLPSTVQSATTETAAYSSTRHGADQQQQHNRGRARFSPYSRHSGQRREDQSGTGKHDCQRCGWTHDPARCPAWRKQCNSCGLFGHFSKMCRSTSHRQSKSSVSASGNRPTRA